MKRDDIRPTLVPRVLLDTHEPDRGIFVPAIMGAGIVFSAATALLDLVQRGTSVATGRNARVRGRLAAENVLGSCATAPSWRFTRSRRVLAVIGTICIAFAVYVAVGSTGNFLRRGGYLSSIGWLWAGSLAIASLAAIVGVAAVAAAWRPANPFPWIWPVLLRTPLVESDVRTDRWDRLRWAAIASAVAATVLTVLVAGRSVMGPFDRTVAAATKADWMAWGGSWVRWVGATEVSLVVLLLALPTRRSCNRLLRVSAISLGLAILLSGGLRALLDRERPPLGPMASVAGSYPSGHVTQAVLLAFLLPLVMRASSPRTWYVRVTGVVCAGLVGFAALHRVATAQHWPTDVVAGALIGAAIGLWARGALIDPAPHRHCRGCAFQSTRAVRSQEPGAP